MKDRALKIVRPVLVVAVLGIVVWANAGDLNPPAGPVAPTGRFGPRMEINSTNTPGDADSLYVISQSGSYYLAGNLTGISGKSGIKIATSDVTLDLNGFALVGVPGSARGISILTGVEKLTIRNGVIRGWGDFGVGPQDHIYQAPHGLYEDLAISGNGLHGLIAGNNSRIINCSSSSNQGGGDGFSVNSGSIVQNCVANGNGTNGFVGGPNCAFLNCTATGNGPSSYAEGFDVEAGCTLTNCTANSNGANGIRTKEGCTVNACTANGNTADGINTREGCTVTGCSAYSNTGNGIDVHPGSTVKGCTTRANQNGIRTEAGCNVTECTSTSNDAYGIYSSDSLIRGNTAINNASANINGSGLLLIENLAP